MSRLVCNSLLTGLKTATRNISTSLPASGAVIAPHVLKSIEVSWKQMPEQEREVLREQLQGIQKQDWSKLSIEEKRASYYVAFGPHGPREPFPSYGPKVFIGTLALLGVSCLTFFGIRSLAPPAPHTFTKEWQEATNEQMKAQKANPITGYTSEGYKGKGWVDTNWK